MRRFSHPVCARRDVPALPFVTGQDVAAMWHRHANIGKTRQPGKTGLAREAEESSVEKVKHSVPGWGAGERGRCASLPWLRPEGVIGNLENIAAIGATKSQPRFHQCAGMTTQNPARDRTHRDIKARSTAGGGARSATRPKIQSWRKDHWQYHSVFPASVAPLSPEEIGGFASCRRRQFAFSARLLTCARCSVLTLI